MKARFLLRQITAKNPAAVEWIDEAVYAKRSRGKIRPVEDPKLAERRRKEREHKRDQALRRKENRSRPPGKPTVHDASADPAIALKREQRRRWRKKSEEKKKAAKAAAAEVPTSGADAFASM